MFSRASFRPVLAGIFARRAVVILSFSVPLVVCASSRSLAQVSGIVRELVSRNPIAGALVSLQASGIHTLCAADGTFSLPQVNGSNLTIVGAHKGYFNKSVQVTTPAVGIEILLPIVPPDEDPAYNFYEAGTCAECHPDQEAQWNGSPMQNAGVNTWLYDLYDGTGTPGGMGGWVYTRDSEHAAENPASECASCHQPEPWIEQPFRALEPIGELTQGSYHGISCEVCHKIADVDESKMSFPGIYPGYVTFTRPAGPSFHQVQYGVLGDTDYSVAPLMRPSYQPQLTAAVCGVCHQDKNDPDLDGDFEEANGVISEPTYIEWLESPYGDPESPTYETCVDCHMPSYGATQACIALNPPLIRDPETIRHHRIEGTTAAYLDNAVDLGIEVSVTGSDLTVTALLKNDQTGHHVPTGVTIRNMILLVEAWREADGTPLAFTGSQTVHALGGVGDPTEGYYAGLPGKLYAKVNHDAEGNGPVFFTEATGIQFDNRIPALATDTTSYRFTLPEGGDPVHVRARVLYRRAFRVAVDAKGWTQDGHGNPLEDLAAPHFGHLMEAKEWVGAPAGVADGSPPNALELRSSPNPAIGGTRIHFDLPEACRARVSVYDLAGRHVADLLDETRAAGHHTIDWSGMDGAGAAVPSGIYLVRLQAGGAGALTRRVVSIR